MSYSKATMERAMKVQEVILWAISKQIHWFETAKILRLSAPLAYRSVLLNENPSKSTRQLW